MSASEKQQPYKPGTLSKHVWLLQSSLRKLTGIELIRGATSGAAVLEGLNQAHFAVVSHGPEKDPIFNYANPKALELFEMDLVQFTQLPSRKSAEAPNRAERERLLKTVSSQGYINNYKGIRISAKGKRFRIQNATVWNLVDEQGRYCGQAAMIPIWEYLKNPAQNSQVQQQHQQQQ